MRYTLARRVDQHLKIRNYNLNHEILSDFRKFVSLSHEWRLKKIPGIPHSGTHAAPSQQSPLVGIVVGIGVVVVT